MTTIGVQRLDAIGAGRTLGCQREDGTMSSKMIAFSLMPKLGLYDLVILVHACEPPADAEWNQFVEAIMKFDPRMLRGLVISDGQGPNSVQRQKLHAHFKGNPPPVALITSSQTSRLIATALSWFNFRVAARNDVGEALDFLEIPRHEHLRVRTEVKHLRQVAGYLDDRQAVGHR
jgi:hypothetical protein